MFIYIFSGANDLCYVLLACVWHRSFSFVCVVTVSLELVKNSTQRTGPASYNNDARVAVDLGNQTVNAEVILD